MAERVRGLPLGRRIDVQIDDADAAFLEHVDAFLDRRLDVGGFGDRADADSALRFGEFGNVRRRVLHAQADPAVLDLAAAGARHVLLMQLVVEIGAVVVDQHQERDAVMRGAPDRSGAHAEIAVAQHRDGVAALLGERERRADRQAGARAQTAAAVLAQIRHAVVQRPQIERPAAAERAERDVLRIVELVAQRQRHLLHADSSAVGRLGFGRHLHLPRLLAAEAGGSFGPAPTAAAVGAIAPAIGESAWYSMLAPVCRFWSSEHAMIVAPTLPALLAWRSAPPRSTQSSARMTSASHSNLRAWLPSALNGGQ